MIITHRRCCCACGYFLPPLLLLLRPLPLPLLLASTAAAAAVTHCRPYIDNRNSANNCCEQCFLLNSTARFTGGKAEGFGSESKMIGDATETGLVRFAADRLLGSEDVEGFRDDSPKVNVCFLLMHCLFVNFSFSKVSWCRCCCSLYFCLYFVRVVLVFSRCAFDFLFFFVFDQGAGHHRNLCRALI